MSTESNIDIHQVKAKIENFHWKNYKRDFQNDYENLKSLYWYCVLSDLMNVYRSHDSEEKKQEGLKYFSVRFFKSYLGCFFKAHHLYHSLLDKFNGLTAYYHDIQQDTWHRWKKRVEKVRAENYTIVCKSVERNFERQRAISPNLDEELFDVTVYDDWHKILSQKVSNELKKHLHHGTLNRRKKGTEEAIFLYQVDVTFIDEIHKYALKYFKTTMILEIIKEVDKRFENGERKISAKKSLQEYEVIKNAVNAIIGETPELKNLSHSQLAYLIRLKYQNADGNELKFDSIMKAIKRMDI